MAQPRHKPYHPTRRLVHSRLPGQLQGPDLTLSGCSNHQGHLRDHAARSPGRRGLRMASHSDDTRPNFLPPGRLNGTWPRAEAVSPKSGPRSSRSKAVGTQVSSTVPHGASHASASIGQNTSSALPAGTTTSSTPFAAVDPLVVTCGFFARGGFIHVGNT